MADTKLYRHSLRHIDCDAILFDLDGVLIDSSVCIQRHWQEWAQRHGLNLANIMEFSHGRRTVETIRLVAPDLDAEYEAKQLAILEAEDTNGIISMEGAASLLSSLPKGTWSVATSGTRAVAQARLKQAALPIPDVLVAAEDVVHGKPDPEVYCTAARRLGIPFDRCVVVEDAPVGVEAARVAGMRVIAIATTHPPERLFEADVIIRQLREIQVEKGNGFRFSIRWLGEVALDGSLRTL